MRIYKEKRISARTLGVLLAAATVAVPVFVALLVPARASALPLLALVLPFVTMGLLDAALRSERMPNT